MDTLSTQPQGTHRGFLTAQAMFFALPTGTHDVCHTLWFVSSREATEPQRDGLLGTSLTLGGTPLRVPSFVRRFNGAEAWPEFPDLKSGNGRLCNGQGYARPIRAFAGSPYFPRIIAPDPWRSPAILGGRSVAKVIARQVFNGLQRTLVIASVPN